MEKIAPAATDPALTAVVQPNPDAAAADIVALPVEHTVEIAPNLLN